ncbi:hypothetical protein O3G_MSEX009427 [Manduca sexta]|uniref:Uncharacterized protein n=1 Tax=Manduca sexta TaxID=7130 RepID=A0A921ZDB0_MANSE|nr:hypothetical protein O3G_MSEX009427 [Manduca sexta]
MEHSRLLKFLVPGRSQSTEMAETPSFKVQYEYQNPENVESEVPGSQNIREITEKAHDETTDGAVSTEIEVTDNYSLEPVITITKKEATFSKGDLKLQKITVTEDISVKYQHLFKKETQPGKTVVTSVQKFEYKY